MDISNNKVTEESVHTIFEFYRRTRKLARKIEYYRDKRLSDFPISGSQLYGLWSIYVLRNCTNAQLADYSGLAKNSVSSLVNLLQKEGYITTTRDGNDARITIISLSNKGKNIIMSVIKTMDTPNPKFSDLVEVMSEKLISEEDTFNQIRSLLSLK